MKDQSNYLSQRKELIDNLVKEGIISSKEVTRSMLTVPREEFVWPTTKPSAYSDQPLPLGSTGQTISAPHMIAIMLEDLELSKGMKILEIGTGSGYNAALMAEIISPTPNKLKKDIRVITVERVPDLVTFARKNLQKTGYSDRVEVILGDGTLGYPKRGEEMLYDRVTITAASPHLPKYLKAQLKVGGILLAPVGDLYMQTLIKAIKKSKDKMISSRKVGCMFVPLIGEEGYK
jgi:protein-L-isoaspartate(D-aspartate) O-methyltransferase